MTEFGGPEVLRAVELPVPQPGPGEVLIKVELAGLNFALYYIAIEPKLLKAGPAAPTPISAKAAGVTSLVLWFGALSFGRLLPYLGTGGG